MNLAKPIAARRTELKAEVSAIEVIWCRDISRMPTTQPSMNLNDFAQSLHDLRFYTLCFISIVHLKRVEPILSFSAEVLSPRESKLFWRNLAQNQSALLTLAMHPSKKSKNGFKYPLPDIMRYASSSLSHVLSIETKNQSAVTSSWHHWLHHCSMYFGWKGPLAVS